MRVAKVKTLKYNNKGFTLIEILVASVILFSTIAIVTVIYKNAMLVSEKANNHVVISGFVPIMLSNIRQEIRGQGDIETQLLKGSGNSWGVDYRWSANLIEFKSAAVRYDPDTGKDVSYPAKYKLWNVILNLNLNGTQQQHQFKELSWNEK